MSWNKEHMTSWTIKTPRPSRVLETLRRYEALWKSVIEFLEPDDADSFVGYYESRFPGMGFSFAELMAPFYSPKLTFELRPPHSNLRDYVSLAVRWRAFGDVRTVTAFRDTSDLSLWDKAYVPDELASRLGAETVWEVRRAVRVGHLEIFGEKAEYLTGGRGPYARDDFSHFLGVTFGHGLRYHVDDWMGLGTSLQSLYLGGLEEDLLVSLELAIGFRMLGDQAKDLQPFLNLWRSGNVPLGFDPDGNFFVLCAEQSSEQEKPRDPQT